MKSNPNTNSFLKRLVSCVCVFCLLVCIHTMCMPGAHGGQKWVLCLQDLGFLMVVSHLVDP